MRTVGQGQAAVPGERVRRRRRSGLPGLLVLGRGRTSCGLSRGVERYPEVPGRRRGRPVYHGVRFRTPWFCFARTEPCVGSKKMRRNYL